MIHFRAITPRIFVRIKKKTRRGGLTRARFSRDLSHCHRRVFGEYRESSREGVDKESKKSYEKAKRTYDLPGILRGMGKRTGIMSRRGGNVPIIRDAEIPGMLDAIRKTVPPMEGMDSMERDSGVGGSYQERSVRCPDNALDAAG